MLAQGVIPNTNPNLYTLNLVEPNFILVPIIAFEYNEGKIIIIDLNGRRENLKWWIIDTAAKQLHAPNEPFSKNLSLDSFCAGITEEQKEKLLEQIP